MRRIVTGLVEAEYKERFRVYDGWLTPEGFIEVDMAQHGATACKMLNPDHYDEMMDIERMQERGEDLVKSGEMTQEEYDWWEEEYGHIDVWENLLDCAWMGLDQGWIRISEDTIMMRYLSDELLWMLRKYLREEYPEQEVLDGTVLVNVGEVGSNNIPVKALYDKSVTADDIEKLLLGSALYVGPEYGEQTVYEPPEPSKQFRPRVVPRRRAKGKPRTAAQQQYRIGDSKVVVTRQVIRRMLFEDERLDPYEVMMNLNMTAQIPIGTGMARLDRKFHVNTVIGRLYSHWALWKARRKTGKPYIPLRYQGHRGLDQHEEAGQGRAYRRGDRLSQTDTGPDRPGTARNGDRGSDQNRSRHRDRGSWTSPVRTRAGLREFHGASGGHL
jgi:hypothetical protein